MTAGKIKTNRSQASRPPPTHADVNSSPETLPLVAAILALGGDPAPGQGWGCDGWDPVYLLASTDPGCLVSPPPELIWGKENKEFHYVLTIAHLYLQLTFFEYFLYAGH